MQAFLKILLIVFVLCKNHGVLHGVLHDLISFFTQDCVSKIHSLFLCGAIDNFFMTVIFYCMITHNEFIHLLMGDCVVSSLAVTD